MAYSFKYSQLVVKCSDLTNLLKKYVLQLCLTQKEFYMELDLNGS